MCNMLWMCAPVCALQSVRLLQLTNCIVRPTLTTQINEITTTQVYISVMIIAYNVHQTNMKLQYPL